MSNDYNRIYIELNVLKVIKKKKEKRLGRSLSTEVFYQIRLMTIDQDAREENVKKREKE